MITKEGKKEKKRQTCNRDISFSSIESLGPNNVKSGNTKQLLLIVHTSLLEDLCCNWNSRVHWVADHINKCLLIQHKKN